MTIVNPPLPTTTTMCAFKIYPSVSNINATTGWTLNFGNGSAGQSGGHTGGYLINVRDNASNYVYLGNVVVNVTGGTANNRWVTSDAITTGIRGNLTINSGGEFRVGASHYFAGDITNNGTFTHTAGTVTLASFLNSAGGVNSVAQTIGGSGVFRNSTTTSTASFTSLNVTNNNATGVTLSAPLSISGTLTLSSGKINTTATNLLTLGTSTVAGTLAGAPSATNMIVGPFARTFASSRTAAGTYDNTTLYPVGKGSTYTPIFIDPTTAAAGAATIRGEAFATNSGTTGTNVSGLSSARWEVLTSAGFANVTNANIRVSESNITSGVSLVQAPTAAGAYTGLASGVSTYAAGPILTGTGISATALTANGYFAYATLAPCVAPANQATAFSSSVTSTSVTGSFTGAASSPSGYIVVRFPSGDSPT
jgi:hypothetical protein